MCNHSHSSLSSSKDSLSVKIGKLPFRQGPQYFSQDNPVRSQILWGNSQALSSLLRGFYSLLDMCWIHYNLQQTTKAPKKPKAKSSNLRTSDHRSGFFQG